MGLRPQWHNPSPGQRIPDRGSVSLPLLAVLFLLTVALFAMFLLGQAAYLQWRAQTAADAAALAAARQTREDMLEAAKAIAREDYARAAAIMARAPGDAAASAGYYAALNRSALTSFDWLVLEVEVRVATNDVVRHPCVAGGSRSPGASPPPDRCDERRPHCSPQPHPSGSSPPSARCEQRRGGKGTRGKAVARARIEVKIHDVSQHTTPQQYADIRLVPARGVAVAQPPRTGGLP